jgi:hypothetical protein
MVGWARVTGLRWWCARLRWWWLRPRFLPRTPVTRARLPTSLPPSDLPILPPCLPRSIRQAVFTSPYAHILSQWGLVPKGSPLDIGLAVSGLLLYSGFLLYPVLTFIPGRKYLLLGVSAGSVCFSLYLLYVLKFILGEFCIVCTTFHAVNFSMFYVVLREFRHQPKSNTE